MKETKIPLHIIPEVKDALNNKQGIVALESTIISHGMPYPTNIETARTVENIVRENDTVPATVGIIDGVVHVGLSDDELEFMGDGQEY